MSDFQPIREACTLFGSASELARRMNVPRMTVSEWATGKRPVPIIRCVEIEELTGGAVTRKQLRPDDWWQIWPDLRGTD